MRKIILGNIAKCILVFLACKSLYAFTDTTRLKEVLVVAKRWHTFNVGQKVIGIDSTIQSQFAGAAMADVLAANSWAFVRANGAAGLGTVSVRGMDAAHFQVIWKGINITNPMNGTIDAMLFPANMFTHTQLQLGGNGTQWGNGAVGGTLLLDHKNTLKSGFSGNAQTGIGSFGHFFQHYKITVGTYKFTLQQQFLHQQATNNYPYYDRFWDKNIRQASSQIYTHAYIAHAAAALNNRHTLEASYWYQWNRRNIPTSVGSQPNLAYQNDESHRAVFSWLYTHKNWHSVLRAGAVQDQIIYAHHKSLFYFFNQSNTLHSEAETQYDFSVKSSLKIGINHQYFTAKAKTFVAHTQQHRTSAFVFYKYRYQRHSAFQLGFRQQWINRSLGVPTPSLGVEQTLYGKHVLFTASASRVYRYPTLNDLFWFNTNELGNPHLLPETGWNSDAGLQFNVGDSTFHKITINPTVFYNQIRNRIFWRIVEAGTLSPVNVNEVTALGAELTFIYSYHTPKNVFRFWANGDYTQAIITQSNNLSEIGKQLPHVPYYKFTLQSVFERKEKFQIGYLHAFTGFRYTNTLNTEFLNEFNTAQLFISGQLIRIKNIGFSAQARVINLWNQYYEVMGAISMPGRHYQCTVVCNFYSPKFLKPKNI